MIKVLAIFLFIFPTFAQDEWFFKDMMSGKIKTIPPKKEKVHYRTLSKAYSIDVTGDGVREFLYFEFLDGKIFLNLRDNNKKPIYRFKFPLNGHSARVYRVLKKRISQTRTMLLFYFYEGDSSYLNKKGTASIYGGVVEEGSFKYFELKKLASIWLEEEIRDTYKRRLYEVGFKDVDNNGQKELLVKSGSTSRVVHYIGKGKWIGL
jgi:hypothetical protein